MMAPIVRQAGRVNHVLPRLVDLRGAARDAQAWLADVGRVAARIRLSGLDRLSGPVSAPQPLEDRRCGVGTGDSTLC